MAELTVFRPTLDASVVSVDSLDRLDTIRAAGCAAVVLQRPDEPSFLTWLATLPAENLPRARKIVHISELSAALQDVFQTSGTPSCAERGFLAQSITALAEAFSAVMRAPWVWLRLDVVTGNACRRFHVDAITARLVCTYRGTGTQYGIADGAENPVRIRTVPTGHPIVLRGSRWPESPPSGLKHRSPPIEGTGETRLLLVLDPVYDPEDEG